VAKTFNRANIIQKQGMYNMLRNMDVNELRQKLIQFCLSNSNDPDVQIAYEIIKKFLNNEK
jgi:Trp operon repressor